MSSASRAGVGMTSMRTRQRLMERLRASGIIDEAVLAVLEQTPRHLFLDEALAHRAYQDTPLPIGHNQTISQPYMVALMTELLGVSDGSVKRILDIGTGCGYQTAILSQLATWVFTVECIDALSAGAQKRLQGLGYTNISYKVGDGYRGWENKAPFDGIIVAAAPPAVPEALKKQLAVGGKLVIPVGSSAQQQLKLIERSSTGFSEYIITDVKFVPLVSHTE